MREFEWQYAPKPVRRLLVNCYFALKWGNLSPNMCQNQCAGCSWIAISSQIGVIESAYTHRNSHFSVSKSVQYTFALRWVYAKFRKMRTAMSIRKYTRRNSHFSVHRLLEHTFFGVFRRFSGPADRVYSSQTLVFAKTAYLLRRATLNLYPAITIK